MSKSDLITRFMTWANKLHKEHKNKELYRLVMFTGSISIRNNWFDSSNEELDTLEITICNNRKSCNSCGRLTPYKINRLTFVYGHRLCWEHLPLSARLLLKYYYLDTINRDNHNFIFGDKL